MNAATAKFLIIYVIVVVIVDIITRRAEIPLKFRILCAFIVTIVFLIL
jgi:hypothetical protein